MIDWLAFTWEAAAGFAAVIIAGFVGWRQVGLTARQTELSENQIAVALWDRRFEIYSAVRECLAHIVLAGSVPGSQRLAGGPQRAPELSHGFNSAMRRAPFLFGSTVLDRLKRIDEDVQRLKHIQSSADVFYEPGKTKLTAEAAEIRDRLVVDYNGVEKIFEDDLQLVKPVPPR